MSRRKHRPAKTDLRREKRLLILIAIAAALLMAFTVWISI